MRGSLAALACIAASHAHIVRHTAIVSRTALLKASAVTTDGDSNASLPSLPAEVARDDAQRLEGNSAKLDALGPIVVAEDGQMRRITNWEGMS